MTRTFAALMVLGFCALLGALACFVFDVHKPELTLEQRLRHYPLLQKTGKTLPELLKLDDVKEVWQLCTGDPQYERRNYITNETETRLAEEALKRLFLESTSLLFYDDDLVSWNERVYEEKDSSLNSRLAESVCFESNVDVWLGPTNLLISRRVTLQPSGLTIVWKERADKNIILWDSLLPYACDVQSCQDFVGLLEDSLIQLRESLVSRSENDEQ